MKFFFPGLEDAKDAEQALKATAQFVKAAFPNRRSDRIYTLGWTRHGEKFYAQVGAPLEAKFGGEIVLAILRDKDKFLICTESNGVLRGIPIAVYPDNLPAFVRFEG